MSTRTVLPRPPGKDRRPGGRLGGRAGGGLAPVRFGPPRPSRVSGLLRRATARQSALRHFDWLLMAAVLALSLLGTLLVVAATASSAAQASTDPYLRKQLINIVLGLIFMAAVSLLDQRRLRLYTPVLYGLSLLGLLAVLTPLGTIVNGARSWIALPGGFQIEPSEFGKLAIILMLGMTLGELRHGQSRPGLRAVAAGLAAAAVPIALVAAEPDLGVVMLMAAIGTGMVALSGIRLRWLAALLAAGVLGIVAVVNLHLLKAYQLSRLTSFLHPAADPRGTGYSAAQAKIAIGSGGLHGLGLFHGPLVAGNFVPEQQTDFIFAVAGEELGFIGALIILGLLAIVLVRALRIAARADDQFGTLVACGIAIWFAVQAFINIGMTIGIMPVTGLPLPFVSYGGSAMFADMIAIGVLQSIHRRRSLFTG